LDNPQLRFRWDPKPASILEELRGFDAFGKRTLVQTDPCPGRPDGVLRLTNEFWTARQRQASSLHEVSYRACFKPQLPRFFIDRLTKPGEIVYDPFMGRGTTPLEAALAGRQPWGADISPLSRLMLAPRLDPPPLDAVRQRLESLDLESPARDEPEDLLAFYHPGTLRAVCRLREYLLDRGDALDGIDAWIRMVALNRLTGHSPGFFSVYTLPPNQATSVRAQRKINEKRAQVPPPRDVRALILRKSRSLMSDFSGDGAEAADALSTLRDAGAGARLLTAPADSLPDLPLGSVSLVVTSPPFLDIVDYAGDNWLRCWFCGVDATSVPITKLRDAGDWELFIGRVLGVLRQLLKPDGHVAFEVGEVRKGSVSLEEAVLRAGVSAGLKPVLVMVNSQNFTKTANCWGVDNNSGGTNSNRIVLFAKG
jgi:hypothetical protein